MNFKPRNLRALADMVVGNANYFAYRSSSYITEFFQDCDLEYSHDGSTRWAWTANKLAEVLAIPSAGVNILPDRFIAILRRLMDLSDATDDDPDRSKALEALNAPLRREGFEAYYAEDRTLYVRHLASKVVSIAINPHRPLTPAEQTKREQLANYLTSCSEDDLIENILLPLFRQLGFHRITAAGHKDKALEYGKDIWMRYTLPTQHILYFGIQAKKGKIDSSGVSNSNIGEKKRGQVLFLITLNKYS